MKIGVFSDGGWGTALALLLVENGHEVTMWGPFPEYLKTMESAGENTRYLPGIRLDPRLRFSPEPAIAAADAELLLLAAPTQYARALLEKLRGLEIPSEVIFVNVAKGIEIGSLLRVSEIFRELLGPRPYAVLSGPSHAEEVARKVPTAVVAAAEDSEIADKVQQVFMNSFFRVYTSADVTGVELGGALKNVLAVAAGICDGLKLGDNAKAALLTRGIAELARLGERLGGARETFSGLSGIGDVIVTCCSAHSRNRHVGEELGRGRKLEDIIADMHGMVAEGVHTARSAFEVAAKAGIDTPIINEIHAVIYAGKDPRLALTDLMSRTPKPEIGQDF